MNKYELLSKRMAFILRWRPDTINVTLTKQGYVDVNKFITGYNKLNKANINIEDLEYVVSTDDKTRYSFNEDKTMIRANQGHSKDLGIEVDMIEKRPPAMLYHGTTKARYAQIKHDGLKPMSRTFVHLTDNKGTAFVVAKRYAKFTNNVAILAIDTARMIKDGYRFKISENGVWQIKSVEPKYIKEIVK